MNWVSIPEDYLLYLRKIDERIPYSDYGKKRFKPFFSPLFEIDDLVYVTQVSSPKQRHINLKLNIDFTKLYNAKNELLAVINLN